MNENKKEEKETPTKASTNLISNLQHLISNDHNGITLIALIITIIIMLILVAVSITVAIKGDLFGITKQAAKQMTIESYKENLEAIRVNAMMEQIKNNLTTVGFMDKVEEGITANKVFEKRQSLKKTSKSVKVTTKEGYLFKITENKVMYMGLADEQGELTLDLVKDKNTFFTLNPSTPTNGQVTVVIDISVDEEELGAVLQYSTDGNNWQAYEGPISFTDNGPIHARLYSEEEDEVGSVAEDAVGNIDRLSPKAFTATATAEGYTSIKVEGSTSDAPATSTDGMSGIKAYYYSKDNGATWEPQNGTQETSYTFEGLKDGKTYNQIKMKAVDEAGNEFVTTNEITVTLPEMPKPHVGDYIDYEPDSVTRTWNYSSDVCGIAQGSYISQKKLEWQILKIYSDGSMDLIGGHHNGEMNGLRLSGAVGYNNGVFLLHDICEKLYSKPSVGITARSVSIEDFEDEDLLNEGAKWKENRDKYPGYGEFDTINGKNAYYPNLYAVENGSGIGVKIESTDTEEQIKAKLKQDGIKSTDKYYAEPTKETYSPLKPSEEDSLTVTKTYYQIYIDETNYGEAYKSLNHFSYWVASRCVDTNSVGANFGLFLASGFLQSGMLFNTPNYVGGNTYKVRPVVHVGPGLELSLSSSASDYLKPHHIVHY